MMNRKYGIVIEIKINDEEEKLEEYVGFAITQMKEKEYYKELVLDKVEYAMVFMRKMYCKLKIFHKRDFLCYNKFIENKEKDDVMKKLMNQKTITGGGAIGIRRVQ